MLHSQGYHQWHAHKRGIRAIALNAFPRIRAQPRVARYTDLIGVLSAHFELERSWANHRLVQQEHHRERKGLPEVCDRVPIRCICDG